MAATVLHAIVRFRLHGGDVVKFKRFSAQCMKIVGVLEHLREGLGDVPRRHAGRP